MSGDNSYRDELRKIRSLLIVTSLQKRKDIKALQSIESFSKELDWEPLEDLMIDRVVWKYVVHTMDYEPKYVFSHPSIIMFDKQTSLYYRCLCGLSLKSAKEYVGNVESMEEGKPKAKVSKDKALRLSQIYNTFMCSIIQNSIDWTLENGKRTIIATLGITLDGVMRNRIGEIAEERIRTLLLDWLIENNLIVDPTITKEMLLEGNTPRVFRLVEDLVMRFGSEPDVAFYKDAKLLATLEIKGGIDPAGALERYGAATKSFQHAIASNPHCKNFYVGGIFTEELERRITSDRLVEKVFSVIDLLDVAEYRTVFFKELFHHVLRLSY
jgi:hypothetical protein